MKREVKQWLKRRGQRCISANRQRYETVGGKKEKAADGLGNCAKTGQSERKFRQPGENGQTARGGQRWRESREKKAERELKGGAARWGEARRGSHTVTQHFVVFALSYGTGNPLCLRQMGGHVCGWMCVYVRAEWCWSQAGQREWLLGFNLLRYR